jgi:sugar (pentulose or hexulose) kinase
MTYLGIDIGSTHLKIIAIDGESRTVTALVKMPIPRSAASRESPTRYEVEPEALRGVLGEALRGLCEKIEPRKIAAIGLCSQMHGALLLDRDRKGIGAFIGWQDTRAESILEELRARTGINALRAGHTLSLLYWISKNDPARMRETASVVLMADFVAESLTGTRSEIHASNAQSTGFPIVAQDIHLPRWDGSVFRTLGWDSSLLAPITSFLPLLGRCTSDWASEIGLSPKTKVYLPVGDQQASLCGSGLGTHSNDSVNIGTGAQVSRLFASKEAIGLRSGDYEIRPYFDGFQIATRVGLAGGRTLALDGPLGIPKTETYRKIAEDFRQAYQALPKTEGMAKGNSIHAAGSIIRNAPELCAELEAKLGKKLVFAKWDEEAPIGAALLAATEDGYFKDLAAAQSAFLF